MMKKNSNLNVIDFVERNFEVHGEFEGVVYRDKRNGMSGTSRRRGIRSSD
jgi:hypothetical protein